MTCCLHNVRAAQRMVQVVHVSAAGYLIPFACMCGDEYCAAPELLEALDIDHMGVCSTQSPNKTGSVVSDIITVAHAIQVLESISVGDAMLPLKPIFISYLF